MGRLLILFFNFLLFYIIFVFSLSDTLQNRLSTLKEALEEYALASKEIEEKIEQIKSLATNINNLHVFGSNLDETDQLLQVSFLIIIFFN